MENPLDIRQSINLIDLPQNPPVDEVSLLGSLQFSEKQLRKALEYRIDGSANAAVGIVTETLMHHILKTKVESLPGTELIYLNGFNDFAPNLGVELEIKENERWKIFVYQGERIQLAERDQVLLLKQGNHIYPHIIETTVASFKNVKQKKYKSEIATLRMVKNILNSLHLESLENAVIHEPVQYYFLNNESYQNYLIGDTPFYTNCEGDPRISVASIPFSNEALVDLSARLIGQLLGEEYEHFVRTIKLNRSENESEGES